MTTENKALNLEEIEARLSAATPKDARAEEWLLKRASMRLTTREVGAHEEVAAAVARAAERLTLLADTRALVDRVRALEAEDRFLDENRALYIRAIEAEARAEAAETKLAEVEGERDESRKALDCGLGEACSVPFKACKKCLGYDMNDARKACDENAKEIARLEHARDAALALTESRPDISAEACAAFVEAYDEGDCADVIADVTELGDVEDVQAVLDTVAALRAHAAKATTKGGGS